MRQVWTRLPRKRLHGTVSGAIQTPSALLSVPNVEKHSREKTMWPSFLQGL